MNANWYQITRFDEEEDLIKLAINKKLTETDIDSKPQITGERWAVIIGISSYQDTRIPGLRYASADAQAFYNWIVSPEGGKYAPSRVKLLINQEATGSNIKKALFTWLTQAIAEDIVTIYFAGHGTPNNPEPPDNLFLLTYDTQYNNVAATGFPMWDIETALKRFIKAKKVIVIADACRGVWDNPLTLPRETEVLKSTLSVPVYRIYPKLMTGYALSVHPVTNNYPKKVRNGEAVMECLLISN